MKKQRLQFKLLALFMFSLFLLLAVYGGYSIMTYGNRWFSSARNPRVRAQKESVIAGDILDRTGTILATTVDGERRYQDDLDARKAIVHLIGDPQGQVSNAVETFQTGYLYGFKTSFGELLGSVFSIIQAGTVDEMGVCHAKFGCTAVHSVHKGSFRTGDMLCHGTGAVVGGRNSDGFDHIGNGHGFSHL